MSVTENIDRIEQGKTSIISSIKSKGVDVPNDVLINEIAPYINEIQGGGGDVPSEDIVPDDPNNPENNTFKEDFLWFENVDDTDGTITLNLIQVPFIYYSYKVDTEFQLVTTKFLSIPAHSKIYLRWKGRFEVNTSSEGFIFNTSSNCNHNIGGELKNGGLKSSVYSFLFFNDKKLIDASQLKLSATTLAEYCYHQMFNGCTALTQAPALPATTLASNCYYQMFYGCTSLTTAPALPATTLASNCYFNMFSNCTSLTTAPELPATKLSTYCYQSMFSNCTSLTTAPALPATKLSTYCYTGMFNGCTSLTTAPTLPATTLAEYCYQQMFNGCTALTTAPTLPATTLAEYCYHQMFNGCTALTTAPYLPATTLASSCYSNMFSNCKNLNYVKTNVISWNTSPASYWLYNVASSGTVEVLSDSTITENSVSGVPSGWTKRIYANVKNTINIHNVSVLENTISIPNKFSVFRYKTNNATEYTENPKTTALTITLKADETLTIEGICYPSTSTSNFTGITSTENINVSGEVNYSLPYMFFCLFRNSTKLIDASQLKLSATTLAEYCYHQMFNGCTALTQAPALPATTLASFCYSNMFYNCTSLTTAPALPATKLTSFCYQYMFYNCTSLTTAPELPATTLASSCYNSMFSKCSKIDLLTFLSTEPFIYNDTLSKNYWLQNVSSTGTFRTPIENKEWIETYPRSESAVPSGWVIEYIEPLYPEVGSDEDILVIENVDTVEGTVYMRNPNNISIQYSTNGSEFNDYTAETEVPIGVGEKVYFKWSEVIDRSSSSTALVHTSVKYKVYGELKQGYNQYAYKNMFVSESNLTDASKLKLTATTLALFCYTAMFRYCTSLTTAPAILPATKLATNCYQYMFHGCSSLTTAPELPAITLAIASYSSLFMGCKALNYVKTNVINWNVNNTSSWLYGVASSGTVECPAKSTIPSDSSDGVPNGWTRIDI